MILGFVCEKIAENFKILTQKHLQILMVWYNTIEVCRSFGMKDQILRRIDIDLV